jgi:8-oxo-dGTP pyrophosphatase MutT (NUDIX family)
MESSSGAVQGSRRGRLLIDPESIPHDPEFSAQRLREQAVAGAYLSARALRARFAAPPAWAPEVHADSRWRADDAVPRPASVLVPLLATGSSVEVLLTRRTEHLHDHAGQISFPGGRADDGDRDPVHTALREAEEEIGLPASHVDVLGTLPEYVTGTGYRVTPVVGLIEQPFESRLDRFEVDEAFAVPLAFLMDPGNHERRAIVHEAVQRRFYAMPWVSAGRRYFIWGATAAMLRNFYWMLRA